MNKRNIKFSKTVTIFYQICHLKVSAINNGERSVDRAVKMSVLLKSLEGN